MIKSLTLTVLGAFALIACLPEGNAAVNVGEPAPAFTATDSNGVTHNLSDFAGKTVVLEWHNPDCPYVVKHYEPKNMQGLQEKYTGQDVVWLTVNSSAEGKQGHVSAEEANAYVQAQGAAPTAYILDGDGTIGQAFGAKTTPHMFIVNGEGTVVYAGAIDSDTSFRSEKIEGATNYVAQALDAMAAGNDIEVASTKPYGCSVKY